MNDFYLLLMILPLIFAYMECGGLHFNNFVKYTFLLLMVVITGFRYDAGADYFNYVSIFEQIETYEGHVELLFVQICKMIARMGFGFPLLFLFCAILIIIPLAYVIEKNNSQYFFTGIAVYIDSFTFFESWNTIRQAISMTFTLLAVYFFYQSREKLVQSNLRKYLPSILCIFIAFNFHKAVIVIAPVIYWILSRKSQKWNAPLYLAILFCTFIFGIIGSAYFKDIATYMPSMFSGSKYWSEIEQRGVNSGMFHYYLNFSAIVLIFYVNKKLYVNKKGERKNNKELIMLSLLYLSAVWTYNIFINFYIGLRFYWYFYLFGILLIMVMLRISKRSTRFLVLTAALFVPFIYTYISLQNSSYSNISFIWDIFLQ